MPQPDEHPRREPRCDEGSVEEKPGQYEEHRDSDVHPGHKTTQPPMCGYQSAEKSQMGDEHTNGCNGACSVEGWKMLTGR